MTTEEILGQVLMFGYGWSGYEWNEVEEDVKVWISKKNIGSIKTFGWNGISLTDLAAEIRRMQGYAQLTRHKVPLIIATDQEGGWVRHVKDDMTKTPGNIAIGATGRMQDAFDTAFYISRELLALGINMNFAPAVDLYTNLDNYVIGPRAFSDDPELAARLGLAFLMGAEKAGIISTAKHFPGHGDTDVDSHGRMPDIFIDFDTLWNRELVPYKLLIRQNVPAVMSGHLGYPQIEKNDNPASLSSFFLKDILRDKMGFQGVVITDDLDMGGTENLDRSGMGQTAFRALEAGNDILLISRTNSAQKRAWEYLLAKMKDPSVRELVRQKAEKVILLKLKYLKKNGYESLFPDAQKVRENIPDTEGREFFLDHAFRCTTVLRSDDIPLKSGEGRKILLAGQVQAFFTIGRKEFPEADVFRFPYRQYTASVVSRDHLKEIAANYDIIIFCLDQPASSNMLSVLEKTKAKVYVISAYTPVYIREHKWVRNVIAVYGFGELSMKAGFYTLKGRYVPEGHLPVGNMQEGLE